MKREWKPGDVALVTWDDASIAMRERGESNVTTSIAIRRQDDWGLPAYGSSVGDNMASSARPLVVIDPEDHRQVERLHELLNDCAYEADSDEEAGVDALGAALVMLIAPPKPPEPTGRWSVVEDNDDVQWVRADLHRFNCWQSIEGPRSKWASYEDIDVVRLIREGMTA